MRKTKLITIFLGKSAIEGNKLFSFIKANKRSLNATLDHNISELIKNEVNVQNVAAYFNLANSFHLQKLAEFTLRYIERWFPMVVQTDGFLQLNRSCVSKILASSEVSVSSETEVYSAADCWVNYKFQERSQFAENILLKIRFPLLSRDALKSILCSSSSFRKVEKSEALINEILLNTEGFYQNKSSIYHIDRYCSQKSFDITFLECGEYYERNYSVEQVDGNDFTNTKVLTCAPDKSQVNQRRYFEKAVYSNGAIYLTGRFSKNPRDPFWNCMPLVMHKYSLATNTFSEPAEPDFKDLRISYCVCAFMRKVYVMGGILHQIGYGNFRRSSMDICTEFDVETEKWSKVACMNESRGNAAAAVFRGQIVVSGGWYYNQYEPTKTVEVYDHASDSWTFMSSMVQGRSCHGLVAVRSKLFAIGDHSRTSCEIYDSFTRKFVLIKEMPILPVGKSLTHFFSLGDKVRIIQKSFDIIATYDTDQDGWSVEPFALRTTDYDACLKIPKL